MYHRVSEHPPDAALPQGPAHKGQTLGEQISLLREFAPARINNVHQPPEYREHGFAVRPWHYHLAKLLDFWLYQTAEDAT